MSDSNKVVSNTLVECTLHEVEMHRLWQSIVAGKPAGWMASRWAGEGVGTPPPVADSQFRQRGLELLKRSIAEGLAYWIARQDAGCGPRPWDGGKDGVGTGKESFPTVGPGILGILSGLAKGKLTFVAKKSVFNQSTSVKSGDQLLAWIIGDWAISHAPVVMEALAKKVSAEVQLFWAVCHPRGLGLLPPETVTSSEGMALAGNGGEGLGNPPLELFGASGEDVGASFLPLIEGALATRLDRAWKIHHKTLREATSLARIRERARWGRQTWPVWRALLGNSRDPLWLGRLVRWVGEVLEPMDGPSEAFAEAIDWKGASIGERRTIRRDAFLALRVAAELTQKYEDSLRVGYLDEAYDDAQGYLRRFRDAGGAPWRERVPSFVRELYPPDERELSPKEAPASTTNQETNSGEQR